MNNHTGNDADTLELAKLYESQGYMEDARKVYESLAAKGSSEEIEAGLRRVTASDASAPKEPVSPAEQKMASLLEQWVQLLVVQQRIENFKRIKKLLT